MKIQLAARLLSAALLCAVLAACSFDGRIADHAVKYNKTVEEANNSLLLLNILRARDRRPMHFTAISQLRGSLSQSSTGSLGLQIPLGGDASNTFPLTPSLSFSQSTSPGFEPQFGSPAEVPSFDASQRRSFSKIFAPSG